MNSSRDGWHSWALSHNWPELKGEVDAAFSWEDKLYLIQVRGGAKEWGCSRPGPVH